MTKKQLFEYARIGIFHQINLANERRSNPGMKEKCDKEIMHLHKMYNDLRVLENNQQMLFDFGF